MSESRARWGGRAGFVLAAAGSAVGLGNIWKFPYITGENGGGLFVLIYLFCIALVGVPIMMAEIMIGRAAQKQPVGAFEVLQGSKTTPWAGIGWLGVASGFVIMSFYVVVAGWAVDYTLKSAMTFAKPIHDQAEIDATKYRAEASLDDMRLLLIEREAEDEARDDLARIRSQLPPSVWSDHDRFAAALAEASDPAEAERRLRLDPELAEAADAAAPVLEELEEKASEIRAEVAVRIEALDDAELLAQAEDTVRRDAIFDGVNASFGSVATDGWMCTFWSALFMVATILIVSRGIAGGIEKTCRILMPTLVGLMVVMVVYGMFQPGFGEAVAFVFKPDPTKLEASGVLEALGHAFFTLSLGMGAMITYGSYQATKKGLAIESAMIAVLDTVIALLACLMIFPIIFSYDQDPGAGAGLVFKSMPLAFAEIGRGGLLLAILFFGLLVFAALTSAISLLEVVSSYFIDQRGWPRHRAAWIVGGLIFAFSIPTAFASDGGNLMSGWTSSYTGKDFFTVMDELSSNWMLPAGGLLISIYAGWVMPKRLRDAEVTDLAAPLMYGWLLLVRFVAPALVLVVLLQKVGILEIDELLHGMF